MCYKCSFSPPSHSMKCSMKLGSRVANHCSSTPPKAFTVSPCSVVAGGALRTSAGCSAATSAPSFGFSMVGFHSSREVVSVGDRVHSHTGLLQLASLIRTPQLHTSRQWPCFEGRADRPQADSLQVVTIRNYTCPVASGCSPQVKRGSTSHRIRSR